MLEATSIGGGLAALKEAQGRGTKPCKSKLCVAKPALRHFVTCCVSWTKSLEAWSSGRTGIYIYLSLSIYIYIL